MQGAGFPLLERGYDGAPFIYLDSASTTPKPRPVIDAVVRYYETLGANVHRGTHPLAEAATEAYERARHRVAALIGAQPAEIVFTRNATDSFNLLARALNLTADDEVVFPASEHHSNYMPWRVDAKAVLVDIDDEAVPKWQQLAAKITKRTRLVSVAHVSNVTGVIAPVEEWIATAHAAGVPVMIDASQSIAHLPIDVRSLDVDFMGFSSHKMFGPNGVGVLYVRRDRFAELGLGNVGGGMVALHQEDRFEPLEAPLRYEAGTPNIEGVIGLGAAVDYLQGIGMTRIAAHSRALAEQLMQGLAGIPSATVLGRSAAERIALATVSLPLPAMSQQDIARLLADAHGIFVSGGYHCAHVLHHRLHLAGTLRASAQIYNDAADIEAFVAALREL
ncbi:MAG TPA: cysteine desulfurase [Gammaproteobacteria bacterium]|jgi:cysteine desulfurase/selenocysteine lyase|nr:cysteine desulfurase [Gammaproteobacteria bacterium]